MRWLPLLLLACGTVMAGPAVPVAAAAKAPLPGDSLYHLDMPLTDQAGKTRTLAEFRGQPVVISMFYANCPMACPMLINDIQQLEDKLDPKVRADLRVVLVSLDPERDTPELLAETAKKHSLDTARWTLLRTEHKHVRTIASTLSIKYRAAVEGEMNHSSILTLLDRDGRIVTTLEGLRRDPSPILDPLNAMSR